METHFVAGATGYTGRAVVEELVRRGVRTVAHIRPDSPRLADWTEKWSGLGAEVDVTPWDGQQMGERLRALGPTHVYALLGTTRRRARDEGMSSATDAYERIDRGLTLLLLSAAATCEPAPRFVYLSSLGVSPQTRNRYLAVRAEVEAELKTSGVPYTIARPSFITGPDRDESRPGERVAAQISDGVLSVLGGLGARRLRDRYHSTDSSTLARALVTLARDPDAAGRIFESAELQEAARR